MPSKKQELIYVKLDYNEAYEAKKDLLNSEANLLRIAKAIQNHLPLRQKELKMKSKIRNLFKETKKEITQMQNILPLPEIPKILKDKVSIFEEDQDEKQVKRNSDFNQSLHDELEDIQMKLRKLQNS